MGNIFTRLYNGVVYTAQDVVWRFKTKNPRECQADYNLRKITSPIFINTYLDSHPTAKVDGRLPHILKTHPTLANRIVADVVRISDSSNDPLSKILSPDEKREYIAEGVIDCLRLQS